MSLVVRAILAVVVGAAVFLVCAFVGELLAKSGIPIAADGGAFIREWAKAIGLLVAVWYFFTGLSLPSKP